jgi:hypothetical protein
VEIPTEAETTVDNAAVDLLESLATTTQNSTEEEMAGGVEVTAAAESEEILMTTTMTTMKAVIQGGIAMATATTTTTKREETDIPRTDEKNNAPLEVVRDGVEEAEEGEEGIFGSNKINRKGRDHQRRHWIPGQPILPAGTPTSPACG